MPCPFHLCSYTRLFFPSSACALTIMKMRMRDVETGVEHYCLPTTCYKNHYCSKTCGLWLTHMNTQASPELKSTVIGISPVKIEEEDGILRERERDRLTKTATKRKRYRQKEKEKNALAAHMELAPRALLLTFLVGLCKLYPLWGKICGGWTGEDPTPPSLRSAPSIF